MGDAEVGSARIGRRVVPREARRGPTTIGRTKIILFVFVFCTFFFLFCANIK